MAKNSSKQSSNKQVKKKTTNTTKKKKTELNNTTRIRIDTKRLNDSESLDTSFLEGRLENKNKKNKKDKPFKAPKDFTFSYEIIKSIMAIIVVSALLIGTFIFFVNYDFSDRDNSTKVKEEVKEEIIIDDNYLFVGDFYTDRFDFGDYDYHYVKVSNRKFTTKEILESLKENVYDYNPSIVFIQLGINDLDEDVSLDVIINNMSNIIDGIKENRKYATIYIESLYPINKDIYSYDEDIISSNITNEKIEDLNNMLKELANNKKVKYLDVYKELEKDNSLNEDYTDNGVYLNDNGYDVIKKMIKKVVDDEK